MSVDKNRSKQKPYLPRNRVFEHILKSTHNWTYWSYWTYWSNYYTPAFPAREF